MDEHLFLIAKADRSWKNISQHQDERQQGRATARNGKAIASTGASGVGLAYGASQLYPKQVGTFGGVVRDAKSFHAARKIRLAQQNEGVEMMREFGPGPEAERTIKRMRKGSRLLTRRGALDVGRRNPAALVAAGGAGLIATGSGMYAAGRTKARRSEADIARLRRTRSKTG